MDNNSRQAVCLAHIGSRSGYEDNYCLDGRYLTDAMQRQLEDGRMHCQCGGCGGRVCCFVVSDGMGGHNAGEVASRICVQRLAGLKQPLQQCGSLQQAVDLLQDELARINAEVCGLGRADRACAGMGAALVLCVLMEQECAILHVGDCRAYHFDGEQLLRLTKDHTEGQRLLDLGLLTRKELTRFRARKHLNRYIGYDQPGYVFQAEASSYRLKGGVLLLCSDGLTDALDDGEMAAILRQEPALLRAGERMAGRAATAAGADNVTVMLIPIGG